ncbi:MAG: circularly permuted type 2 ATP-grasp protein [Hyphomonadaceae bacterium]|nr:circularly permuted type 2 ATP-grasp protein [Hyphomonadaceae bacterium]
MVKLAEPAASLLADYAPLEGVFDEMVDETGQPRAHWRPFVDALARLGRAEIARRADGAARRLREAGVYYRAYDQDADQAWPLSSTPVIIDTEDWRTIEAGLIQRAELMEAAIADFYGAQRLVRDGHVPASIITGSPDFLRPMVGATPAGGRYLHFYAADLGRAPDGRWWVLADRAQAPSGAGYALGNRIALSRTLPETMHELDVRRLAEFFQRFRETLTNRAAPDSAGVCLLTPGPYNETYYEHAYLARYLGFLLVEGEDLVVRGDKVFLRTVAGLKKVDTLLRRLDADFTDPLALNPGSRLGAPGLVDAARSGAVCFANALGSGIVESRALMAFWPRLARELLGADLKLPNVATWWCGDAAKRDEVIARFDDIAFAPAFLGHRNPLFSKGAVSGRDLAPDARRELLDQLARRGGDFVGQEMVKLSSTPVLNNDRFEPRPFQLRVFLAATENGWTAMPGGFCRVSSRRDPLAINMQRGGLAADAWVISDAPVGYRSLLPSAASPDLRRGIVALTTRTAENMFWLGRYLERADASLRLVRALAARSGERDHAAVAASEKIIAILQWWGALPYRQDDAVWPAADAAHHAMTSTDAYGAPPVLVRRALNAASAIRDQLSPDAWRIIKALDRQMMEGADAHASETYDRAERSLRELAAFSGYAHENMTRTTGWAILDIGRRVERGLSLARFISRLGVGDTTPATLEALLELCDSQITYARRYFVTASPGAVADLLIFDDDNPRACAFQAARLRALLDELPASARADAAKTFRESIVQLEASMTGCTPDRVDAAFVFKVEEAFFAVATAFSNLYLSDHDEGAGR